MDILVSEVRPDGDGGAWVKVIFDVEASHDLSISESIEFNVHVEGASKLSLEDCVEAGKVRSMFLLNKIIKVGL